MYRSGLTVLSKKFSITIFLLTNSQSTSDENNVRELKTEVASMHLGPNDFLVSMMSDLVKMQLYDQFGFKLGTIQRKISLLMDPTLSSDLINNDSINFFKTNEEKKRVKRLGSSISKFKQQATGQSKQRLVFSLKTFISFNVCILT